jgi:hypothetical protein
MRYYICLYVLLALASLTTLLLYSTNPDLYETQANERKNGTKKKTLVMYSFQENFKLYNYSLALKYFLELGVSPNDPCDYVIIVQGFNCSIDISNYPNVKVFRRPNTCFDFGAFGATVEWLGGIEAIQATYDSFIFLNSSALGSILPKY